MWIIAGLGNPGRKYSRTRHNIGFMVIEEIAKKYGIILVDKKEYRGGKIFINNNPVLILEPLLFMNMSGHVIKGILTKFNINPENLIVIHDDLDMTAGKLRIKKNGSSGGHKGIESIIQNIGTKNFIRIKIGIGREEGINPEKYVLSNFKRQEMVIFRQSIKKAAQAAECIISEGVEKAMNKFN